MDGTRPRTMSGEKVLVLCATGKIGSNAATALREVGFDVYGTTRSANSKLASKGIMPVVCNYTVRSDLDRVFKETGAKKVFVITDYFAAAKCNGDVEIQQGINAIEAAKAAGVDHLIFISVADAELFDERCKHIKTKLRVEEYLKASGVNYSILRPTCFFENFDDSANRNPLTKGSLKFLTTKRMKYCSTYDIGRAAAVMFKSPAQWFGKTLDVVSWEGDLSEVAAALEKVSGTKVKYGLVMPILLRKWFLTDLHHMCVYFEENGGTKGEPAEFKKVVPNALSAEDWFRFHGRYANGTSIVPGDSERAPPPSPSPATLPLHMMDITHPADIAAAATIVVVAAAAIYNARRS